MDDKEIKKFMKEKAKELFPEIDEYYWTFYITEFSDNTTQIVLRHVDNDNIKKLIDFIEYKDKIECVKLEKIKKETTTLDERIGEWKKHE